MQILKVLALTISRIFPGLWIKQLDTCSNFWNLHIIFKSPRYSWLSWNLHCKSPGYCSWKVKVLVTPGIILVLAPRIFQDPGLSWQPRYSFQDYLGVPGKSQDFFLPRNNFCTGNVLSGDIAEVCLTGGFITKDWNKMYGGTRYNRHYSDVSFYCLTYWLILNLTVILEWLIIDWYYLSYQGEEDQTMECFSAQTM